ncbi:MAG: chain length-determining protein [Burkholderiaceae bacterium]|nr:chain length-determining protein [Burkholderiaceae bacterium]MBY0469234.1 chain length-determining protein [Burkholderiaceae bacterium]
MEELLAQLTTHARSMWRFRWPSILVAWSVAVAGAVGVFLIPDQYEATSRIYVDTESILKPLMSGLAVQPNVDQQVTMLSRTLISRPNVEKLVRMADLDLKSQSKAEQEALVAGLMSKLQIQSVGRDNLYTLSFRDSDSARAQRVIQSFVSIFIESSLGASRKDSDTAKVFINDQIKAYENKLLEAETRLKEFRLRNIESQAAEGVDSVARIGQLADALGKARLELREAEQARDSARQQLMSEKTQTVGSSSLNSLLEESALSISTPEIDARIATQRQNLDALLQRFTEEHPDVVTTRKLLRDLEDQKKKEVKELRKAAMAAPAMAAANGSSLVSQELNRLLANSEVQVAALKARVAEYSARYNQAREAAKTAPQVEAEASQLNRDYAVNKANYEDLVKRRESASLSGELDSTAGVADFRLIDPPRVSPNPVSPNRFMLLPAAMLAALASGFLTAFVASQLRPVFHSAAQLRTKFDLPLLGTVSMVTNPAEVRLEKVRLIKFAASSGGLVGFFGLLMLGMALMAARKG